jgi:20S proteasome alpha/beta subunit
LKAKTVVFPSGFDLIRAFLKEAYKENTRDIKRKALLNLVVKVISAAKSNSHCKPEIGVLSYQRSLPHYDPTLMKLKKS